MNNMSARWTWESNAEEDGGLFICRDGGERHEGSDAREHEKIKEKHHEEGKADGENME